MHAHHDIQFRGDANGDYIKVASNFWERSKDDIKASPARTPNRLYVSLIRRPTVSTPLCARRPIAVATNLRRRSPMGTTRDTYVNWETGKTEPVAAQFRPVVEFLGYNPTPTPTNLAERLEAKRRALGITFEQAAKYLGWDPVTLARYLNGTWRMPPSRSAILEVFLSARPEDLADGLKAIPRRVR
jgi:hypothetical protein